MVCTYCRSKTKIVNSRHQRPLNQTWRRHRCSNCLAVFTTLEKPLLEQAWRIEEENSKLSPFVREKLFIGLFESCKHRPTAIKDAHHLTDTVIARLSPEVKNATIHRKIVVQTAAEVLKHFDKAAHSHYLAYHPFVAEQ